MEYIALILFLPILVPIFCKLVLKWDICPKELALHIGIVVVLVPLSYFMILHGSTTDVEIWNGQITDKSRDKVSCSHSYPCRCRSVSCGKNCTTTVCDTCYVHPYDVDWNVRSTVGNFKIDRLDSQGLKEPPRWTQVIKGEPASREHVFTNYFKNIDFSTLLQTGANVDDFKELLPQYPRVFDYYRYIRVHNLGTDVPKDVDISLNTLLNNGLRALGPNKQVNVIVFFVNTSDPNYRYALEQRWRGGKRNDVVVLIGTTSYPKIDWADVMTYGQNYGNEVFQVVLRDRITGMKAISPEGIFKAIYNTIIKKYDRPHEETFKYLEDQNVSDLALWILFVFSVIVSIGLAIFFHREKVFETGHSVYNRYRRFR